MTRDHVTRLALDRWRPTGRLARHVHLCVVDNDSHFRREFGHETYARSPGSRPLLAVAISGCTLAVVGRRRPRRRSWPAFYPLQFVAERVGGDRVQVTNLARPGAEPHDLELSPRQVGEHRRGRPGALPARVPAGGRRGGRPRIPGMRSTWRRWCRCSTRRRRSARRTRTTRRRTATRTRTSGSTRPGWPPSRPRSRTSWPSSTRTTRPTYRTRAAELGTELGQLDREFADGLQQLPAARDRRQPRRVRLPRRPVRPAADSRSPGCRRRWSPPRSTWPRRRTRPSSVGATTIFFETLVSPQVAEAVATRSAPRPPCSIRSRGSNRARPGTTFRSCGPTWPRCARRWAAT